MVRLEVCVLGEGEGTALPGMDPVTHPVTEQKAITPEGGVPCMDHKGRERDKKVAAGKDKNPGDNPIKREPGTGKGQILYIADDFDKPLEDFDENK